MPPFFFFFNDTATTEIYTLSLHDALPISSAECRPRFSRAQRFWRRRLAHARKAFHASRFPVCVSEAKRTAADSGGEPKSTRLDSRHVPLSYGGFFLQKKKISMTENMGDYA